MFFVVVLKYTGCVMYEIWRHLFKLQTLVFNSAMKRTHFFTCKKVKNVFGSWLHQKMCDWNWKYDKIKHIAKLNMTQIIILFKKSQGGDHFGSALPLKPCLYMNDS